MLSEFPRRGDKESIDVYLTNKRERSNMSQENAVESSYGFNYKTLACKWLTFGSALPITDNDREDSKEESFDIQWVAADGCNSRDFELEKSKHQQRQQMKTSMRQILCDPQTCMKGNGRRVAVEGSTCNPELCNEIYYCEYCSKCRKHCNCDREEVSQDPSIYEDYDAYVQSYEKK
jgi:hypothetical protein